MSPTTGLPWWLTRSGHPQVTFRVDTVEDGAEAALDRYDEAQRESKAKKRPGVHRYAVPVGIDGFPVEGGEAREALILYSTEQNGDDAHDDLGDLIQRSRPPEGYNTAEYGEYRPEVSA